MRTRLLLIVALWLAMWSAPAAAEPAAPASPWAWPLAGAPASGTARVVDKDGARLLVLGSSGPIAIAALHHAPCPLAVVPLQADGR